MTGKNDDRGVEVHRFMIRGHELRKRRTIVHDEVSLEGFKVSEASETRSDRRWGVPVNGT